MVQLNKNLKFIRKMDISFVLHFREARQYPSPSALPSSRGSTAPGPANSRERLPSLQVALKSSLCKICR
jgi:hypothetical protein